MPLFVFFATDDIRFGHFIVKIVSLACALSDTGEDGNPAVEFGDVIDQFHDNDRFADTGAPEGADLAAFEKRADQVNYLDAGSKDLRRGRLIHQRGGRAVDGIILVGNYGALFIHGLAGDIKDASHDSLADGHGDRGAGVRALEAALETLGAGHGNGPAPVVARMLIDFSW